MQEHDVARRNAGPVHSLQKCRRSVATIVADRHAPVDDAVAGADRGPQRRDVHASARRPEEVRPDAAGLLNRSGATVQLLQQFGARQPDDFPVIQRMRSDVMSFPDQPFDELRVPAYCRSDQEEGRVQSEATQQVKEAWREDRVGSVVKRQCGRALAPGQAPEKPVAKPKVLHGAFAGRSKPSHHGQPFL